MSDLKAKRAAVDEAESILLGTVAAWATWRQVRGNDRVRVEELERLAQLLEERHATFVAKFDEWLALLTAKAALSITENDSKDAKLARGEAA